ncbi:hypothetical protein F9C22_01830 [Mycoplasmoides gallisepticum]|uniref:hypothetical protein n=1 Tax=Mycoplasmoides gallisepticum TaxID=2096 RepID=UPI002187935F|nr:hypothetical protein [Mycoplasmoides gallisepticum]UQZ95510.1 hypothetical protein F9C22_01830 [Mycoplasmoides gallisepticum]
MNPFSQWIKLVEKLHYDSGYVFCNIVDLVLINHLNFHKVSKPLTFFLIYDQNLNELSIFDNSNGFSYYELISLSNFFQGDNEQYHGYFRSLIKLAYQFEFFNQSASEEVGYYFKLHNVNQQLIFNDLKQTQRGEYYNRTSFANGTLIRLKQLKAPYELNDFKVIANQLKLIYQKFINTDKLKFYILYKKGQEFFDLSTNPLNKLTTLDKAKSLAKTKKPALANLKNGKKRILIQQTIDWNNQKIYLSGYLGVLSEPDFKKAGLYLYNNNKLVKGINVYDRYRPELLFGSASHLNNAYLYGELELANLSTGLSSDIFEYDARFEKQLLKILLSIVGDQRYNQTDKISGLIKALAKQKKANRPPTKVTNKEKMK